MATKAELEVENAKLRADLEAAGRFFNEAADAHDLCDQYDQVVAELNPKLTSGFQFTPRGTEQEVQVTLTGYLTTTVKVVARDRFYAQDRVRDDFTEKELFALAGQAEIWDTLVKAGWSFETDV